MNRFISIGSRVPRFSHADDSLVLPTRMNPAGMPGGLLHRTQSLARVSRGLDDLREAGGGETADTSHVMTRGSSRARWFPMYRSVRGAEGNLPPYRKLPPKRLRSLLN